MPFLILSDERRFIFPPIIGTQNGDWRLVLFYSLYTLVRYECRAATSVGPYYTID